MKNNLWIILIAFVIALSSCITAAQFNNAEDDVYYSPKASNRKAPVMIPEVDVDEIIRQHPPQYGSPTNFIEDENYPNLTGAAYYPMYRAGYADSIDDINPRISTYNNPSLTVETERLRRIHLGNSGSWSGSGDLSWLGQIIELGFNSYPSSYAGYNDYYSYCGPYNSYNWWYGWGNNHHPTKHYNSTKNNGNTDKGTVAGSRRRATVGNNTPPADDKDDVQTAPRVSRGRYTAPALPERESRQAQETYQARERSNYTPSTPRQNLENTNGRTVYTRQRETTQPTSSASNTERPTRSTGGWSGRTTETERPASRAPQQSYTTTSRPQNTYSAPSTNTPSTSGRAPASGNSGSSSTSSGRRR